MVQALLNGRKSQTRRVFNVKHLHPDDIGSIHPDGSGKGWAAWLGTPISAELTKRYFPGDTGFKCPYGVIGDVLWVRESFCCRVDDFGHTKFDEYIYRADNSDVACMDADGFHVYRKDGTEASPWKPSIHMPKSACRIFLEITEVRVELLHMLTAFDAEDEGIQPLLQSRAQLIEQGKLFRDYSKKPELFMDGVGAIQSYKTLWESINGLESWDANPWVWMISFKRIDKPEGFC